MSVLKIVPFVSILNNKISNFTTYNLMNYDIKP